MKKLSILIIGLLFTNYSFSQSETLSQEEQYYQFLVDSIENSFHYEYGEISLIEDVATIIVPPGFKYLNAEQSNYVLTELWENPPSETLGLLFPIDDSPLSDYLTYAVEISYSEEGYISDEDVEDLDYTELLEIMQNDFLEMNPERIELGYQSFELIGWAADPFYDSKTKKLHWAKEIKFSDTEENILNYNIRVLGKKGYLNLNAIGVMRVLPLVNDDINKIIGCVEFNEGNTYFDFNPDIDEIASYGIGGLIAGKILAKVGFFAGLLKFWKLIAIGAVGLFRAFRKRIFGSKEETSEYKE
jgi:uncharacterized membrane-anchored protein